LRLNLGRVRVCLGIGQSALIHHSSSLNIEGSTPSSPASVDQETRQASALQAGEG